MIPSPRHTPADLALWKEHEEADLAYGSLPTLGKRVERSLQVLRDFISAGQSYAGASHGKDSTVLMHLLWRVKCAHGIVIPVYHVRAVPVGNPLMIIRPVACLSRWIIRTYRRGFWMIS